MAPTCAPSAGPTRNLPSEESGSLGTSSDFPSPGGSGQLADGNQRRRWRSRREGPHSAGPRRPTETCVRCRTGISPAPARDLQRAVSRRRRGGRLGLAAGEQRGAGQLATCALLRSCRVHPVGWPRGERRLRPTSWEGSACWSAQMGIAFARSSSAASSGALSRLVRSAHVLSDAPASCTHAGNAIFLCVAWGIRPSPPGCSWPSNEGPRASAYGISGGQTFSGQSPAARSQSTVGAVDREGFAPG